MTRPLALLASLGLALGCDPLLGGRCAEGWTPSPGACDAGTPEDVSLDAVPLDAATDDIATLDVATDEAAPIDATNADVAPIDATNADVVTTDAATTDAATTDAATTDGGCTPPQGRCGGACVDTASSREHCGGCGRACRLGEVCASGVCSALCAAPLLLCDGVCLDPSSDPQNCGGCGVVCSTGICNGGRCRDARAGHLVLIGHDYETTRPDQDRVVGNAVFLSGESAPRVSTCTLGARAASVTNVRDAVRRVAGPRPWRETVIASPDALAATFTVDTTDIVLVHHQPDASAESVAALAVRIAGPAVGFVRAGGVVVVLDGEGASAGTWPLAEATGLLRVAGHAVVTGAAAEVVAGGDSVAIGLPVAYRSERGTVGFLGTDGMGVVIRAGELPLVMHQVIFGR